MDLFTEEVNGECVINYYVEGKPADFGEDGNAIEGIEFMADVDIGKEIVDYVFFTGSAVMYTVLPKKGSFGCVLNSKVCLPPKMVEEERIVGLLGSPDGNMADDWMNQSGQNLRHGGDTEWEAAYDYCTTNWCVHDESESIFGYLPGTQWSDYYECAENFDPTAKDLVLAPSQECIDCCGIVQDEVLNKACLLECEEGAREDCELEIENEAVLDTIELKCPDPKPEPVPDPAPPKEPVADPAPPKEPVADPVPKTTTRSFTTPDAPDKVDPVTEQLTTEATVKGDPHFKTFGGELYDVSSDPKLATKNHLHSSFIPC